jgi:hypothetical protein
VPEIQYDGVKFRELMLYIAEKMEDNPSFGATVLNKVLFFSDFLAYRFTGKSITGATYQKLDYGPAPRQLLTEQKRLIDEKSAVLQKRDYNGFVQKRLIPLRRANLETFSGEEINGINNVIQNLSRFSASGVSEFSHEASVGWLAAELGQNIPYSTIFLSPPLPVTLSQVKRAEELALEFAS